MKRNTWAYIVGFGGVVAFGSAHGCAFNPFSPPGYDNRPGATDVVSSSSGGGGVAGMGGSGGLAGQGGNGGVAGQGGTAGAGGAVCVCDGDDANECTTDVMGACPDGNAAKCHEVAPGKACSAGQGFVCNLEGKCESDCLICPNDPACTARCNGQVCPDDNGCKSGYCEQGACCNAECIGPCKSCNREGTVGSCRQLPVGLQVPGCDTTIAAQGKVDACDNDGTCTTFMSAGLPLGAGCGMHSDCISGFCDTASGCVSKADQPCVEDLECASNLCDKNTHLCKACTGAADCREGATCTSGVCQGLPGEPAASSTACAQGTVQRMLCVLPLGSVCSKHEECSSHHCKNGFCQNPCTASAECPAGVMCDPSWMHCRLPKGAYCVPGTAQQGACQSGKCSGFPPRCE